MYFQRGMALCQNCNTHVDLQHSVYMENPEVTWWSQCVQCTSINNDNIAFFKAVEFENYTLVKNHKYGKVQKNLKGEIKKRHKGARGTKHTSKRCTSSMVSLEDGAPSDPHPPPPCDGSTCLGQYYMVLVQAPICVEHTALRFSPTGKQKINYETQDCPTTTCWSKGFFMALKQHLPNGASQTAKHTHCCLLRKVGATNLLGTHCA